MKLVFISIVFIFSIFQGCTPYKIQKKIINNDLESAYRMSLVPFGDINFDRSHYPRIQQIYQDTIKYLMISEEYDKMSKEGASPISLTSFSEEKIDEEQNKLDYRCSKYFNEIICKKVSDAKERNRNISIKATNELNAEKAREMARKEEEKRKKEYIEKMIEAERRDAIEKERDRIAYLEEQKQLKQKENDEKQRKQAEKEKKIREKKEIELRTLIEYCSGDYKKIYVGMPLERLQACSGPFKLTAQINGPDGVVSVYEQGMFFSGVVVHVIDKRVVEWESY